MLLIGFGLVLLMLWSVWAWHRGRLTREQIGGQKWLLRAWMAALPAGYLAMESGWVTREVGRQPWIIYGVLRTGEGVSGLPSPTVGLSLLAFAGVYILLFVLFLVFARRIIRQGPVSEDRK